MAHVHYRPPVFAPADTFWEFDKISKAAWIDIAWNLAARCVESSDEPGQVLAQLREEIATTLDYRKQSAREG